MKKWADKYVIGLTGSIGTGKSVVRRMLEHLGAYGIDADAITHRAISRDAPCFDEIIKTFGTHILTPEGQINRQKLGRIVFNDPESLAKLEAIIHPLVEQAVDLIIRRANQKVIVIEAIKLLESNLAAECDAVWVVYSPPEVQLSRLTHNRNMSEPEARQRMEAQVPQESRFAEASVVIKNSTTFDDTWKQVTAAWQRHVPSANSRPIPVSQPVKLSLGEVNIERAGPKHVDEIVEILNRLKGPQNGEVITSSSITLGEKAYLILRIEQNPMGILAWQVENLVARTTEIALDSALPPAQFIPLMINEMEKASIDLQCEASLIFVPDQLAHHDVLWTGLGYEKRASSSLDVLAWQEAAEESMPVGTTLFFKQLREDRVLRPI
ncbi:MAG TPA: dephospho-CoA kinase [Anaerolineaceae bacterium]|nr:dephospho-CoA kinase [Anaerolineaceae bacterium]